MNRVFGSVFIFILGIGVGLFLMFGIMYYKLDNLNLQIDAKNDVKSEVAIVESNEEVSPTDYMFANSSTEKIDESKLKDLSKFELEVAKNEIFARYGYDFSSQSLREYFNSKSWYKKIEGKKVTVSDLNEIEKNNVVLIDKYLNELVNKK